VTPKKGKKKKKFKKKKKKKKFGKSVAMFVGAKTVVGFYWIKANWKRLGHVFCKMAGSLTLLIF